jgi:hypothetical protein
MQEVGGSTATGTNRVETPKLDGLTSWDSSATSLRLWWGNYKWAPCIKAKHLLAAPQRWASDVLQNFPREVTYEETIEALEDCFGDQNLSPAYGSQLKTRTQSAGESLQKFATAVEQLTYRAYLVISENLIRSKQAWNSSTVVGDPDIKIHLQYTCFCEARNL